jgi:hypothetical protein
MIAMILVLCGILLAAGLTVVALRERAWGLAVFMTLITLVSIAAAYVAFDCLGDSCLLEQNITGRLDHRWSLNDGNA